MGGVAYMADLILEPRSFQPASKKPDRSSDVWTDDADGWDAVASHAFIHRVRWHTGLSQAAFAEAYRIDLDFLKALERGHAQPDSALSAYLTVIDRAPDLVLAALANC